MTKVAQVSAKYEETKKLLKSQNSAENVILQNALMCTSHDLIISSQ